MPLTGQSWRLTLLVYTAIAFLAMLLWSTFARNPRHYSGEAAAPAASRSGSFKEFGHLLRAPVVLLVLLISIGSFLFTHGLNNWLPEILVSDGMTPSQAGFWAAAPTVVGIAGTLAVARLATPSRRIPILIGLFLSTAVGIVLIAMTSGPLLVVRDCHIITYPLYRQVHRFYSEQQEGAARERPHYCVTGP